MSTTGKGRPAPAGKTDTAGHSAKANATMSVIDHISGRTITRTIQDHRRHIAIGTMMVGWTATVLIARVSGTRRGEELQITMQDVPIGTTTHDVLPLHMCATKVMDGSSNSIETMRDIER